MGSKSSRRKRRNKVRKNRQSANRNKSKNTDESKAPRVLQLVSELAVKTAAYAEQSDDFSRHENSELQLAYDCVNRMGGVCQPKDLANVLANVQLSQASFGHEAYREAEDPGLVALIELAALVLVNQSAPQSEHPNPLRVSEASQLVIDECRSAISHVQASRVYHSIDSDRDTRRVSLLASLRKFVRNNDYQHMVRESTELLFSIPEVREICTQNLGFDIEEVLSLFDSLVSLQEKGWAARLSLYESLTKAVMAEMSSAGNPGYKPEPQLLRRIQSDWDRFWDSSSEFLEFSMERIFQESSLAEKTVRRIMDKFSYKQDPEVTLQGEASKFFCEMSPFVSRPILKTGDESYFVVHPVNLIHSIRIRIEEELKRTAAWNRYVKERSDFLEREAMSLLAEFFPGSMTYQNLEYLVPDNESQLSPSEYTKAAEADGLLVVDDIALVVEAKSGGMRKSSRSGNDKKLVADLQKLVTKASEQVEQLRERVDCDRGLQLKNGPWLDLHQVREIHTLTVSLENLSEITAATSDLVSSGIVSSSQLPWNLSYHDLKTILEILDRPAEFLLYVRRRTAPEVTLKYQCVEELDLFMYFLSKGLYVEPDPEARKKVLPNLDDLGPASIRRYKKQQPVMLASMTGELDDWYFHDQGYRRTPARKPTLDANEDVLSLIDWLEQERVEGWLAIGTTLLEAGRPLQRKYSKIPKKLIKKTREDGNPHSCLVAGGSTAVDSFAIAWDTLAGRNQHAAVDKLSKYVQLKKHQLQVAVGIGFLYGSDPNIPLSVSYFNNKPTADPTLDGLVVAAGFDKTKRRRSVVF